MSANSNIKSENMSFNRKENGNSQDNQKSVSEKYPLLLSQYSRIAVIKFQINTQFRWLKAVPLFKRVTSEWYFPIRIGSYRYRVELNFRWNKFLNLMPIDFIDIEMDNSTLFRKALWLSPDEFEFECLHCEMCFRSITLNRKIRFLILSIWAYRRI